MSELKWTPGPWEIGKEYACHTVVTAGTEVVAETACNHDPDQAERKWANARLMATSPELYEMTDKLLAILVGELALKSKLDGKELHGWLRREYPSIQEASDLLAKSRGEQAPPAAAKEPTRGSS